MASPFASTSLYVGDLAYDVTEGNLFDIFSRIAPIASIRVCRDVVSRRSLGYAYVNFHSVTDAEKAMEELKGQLFKTKPLRISWSIRDPSLRKSNEGNVFIKNLCPSIDSSALLEIFKNFGNILSWKLATDESGKSKGYAFVHFETVQSARGAIDQLNGKELNGKIVTVTKFLPRRERDNTYSKFTNIYMNNLDGSVDEPTLRAEFSPFGTVTSIYVSPLQSDLNTKYAFVNYENPEDANHAVEAMNGQKLREKVIFVGRAKKKSEREQELREKFMKRDTRPTLNLYVKNISEEIDSTKLRQLFSPYGELGSVEIMRDEKGNHKGFGFACFMNHEAGQRALSELHGYILSNKPLYIAIAQKKQDRLAQRALRFAAKQRNVPMQQVFPPMYWQAPMIPAPEIYGIQRWAYPQQQPQQQPHPFPGGQNNRGATRGGGRPPARARGGPFPYGGGNQQRFREAQAPPPESTLADYPSESEKSAQEQLDIASHRLYEMISSMTTDTEKAKKITGMLLDRTMNQGNGMVELMHLLDHSQVLSDQVREALIVLQNYQSS
jgi:polyadenylate-binding protein